MKLHRLLMVALLCAPVQLLIAQGGSTGTILGTVTDSSGALVPNARIDVINSLTGVPTHTQAGSAGQYTAPYLSPGKYRIEVQAPGFEKFVAQNVQLAVDKGVRVDAKLIPGAVTQSVQVLANPVALDTDTSSVTQEIAQRQVNDLPLNGRNVLDLLTISGLAVQTVTEASAFRQGAESGISINGERATSNDYTLDGMPNVDASEVQPAIVLSVDAIQEFAQQTETYGAQYGFSANQINLATKSGTNRLHASVHEFDRNNVFDAIGPFQTSLPPLRQNQFGFAAGGPVVIPRLYNGHNRTFWFASYEGRRINTSSQNFYFVPDPANLAGDFTQSITNPTTGTPFPGCTTSSGTYTSCIPQADWSRLAKLAIANHFWPTANTSNPLGNYVRQGNAPVDNDAPVVASCAKLSMEMAGGR